MSFVTYFLNHNSFFILQNIFLLYFRNISAKLLFILVFYLAERITNLLIREQELNQYSRREADKKHFVLQSLIQNDTSNCDYLSSSLETFHIGLNRSYRLILIRIDSRYNLTNLSLIEQKTQEMFALAGISLFTFLYPRDFVAIIDADTYQKQAFIFHTFANENASILQVAVGKSTPVFQIHHSYESALTAINTLTNTSENFALLRQPFSSCPWHILSILIFYP